MAKATPVTEAKPVKQSVEEMMAEAAVNDEWQTVTEAAAIKIIFDTIGDVFIGWYRGIYTVPAEQNRTADNPEGEAFDLYMFRGLDGELYSTNTSAKLEAGITSLDINAYVKLTYVKDVPTKRNLNPMKDITVMVGNRPNPYDR